MDLPKAGPVVLYAGKHGIAHPGAAASLREGIDDIFTVCRIWVCTTGSRPP